MKKAVILFVLLILSTLHLQSNDYSGFKYSALIRYGTGKPIISKKINIRISICESSLGENIIYSEIHNTRTNNLGVVNLIIGKGKVEIDDISFSEIDWNSDINYFLKIDIDHNQSGNFIQMGISQLMSVPYAKFANKSEIATKLENTQDILQDLEIAGSILTISGKENPTQIDISKIMNPEVIEELEKKAYKDKVYTKTEVEQIITEKIDNNNKYSISEVEKIISTKANKDNVYTKDEIDSKLVNDNKLNLKADKKDTYTKGEVNEKLYHKASLSSVIILSDKLDTKLNESHITDNLLSNDPTLVLSANMGYKLKSDINRLSDDINLKLGTKADVQKGKSLVSDDIFTSDKEKIKKDKIEQLEITDIFNLQHVLDNKTNKDEVYTKTEVDSQISQKQDKIAGTPELVSNKGVANGYAGLDSEGKIPSNQLPDMNISETHVVENNADIFTLTSVNKGNLVIVKNENKTYINTSGNNNDMSDWVEMSPPNSGVTTVNNLTGNVTINKSSVGLSNVENKSSKTIRSEITDSDIPNNIARKEDLNSYSTTTEINQKLEIKADKSNITNLTTKVNNAETNISSLSSRVSGSETDISNNKSDIAALQTSIENSNDVIDNLSSDADDKPLSAKQGKILKEQIDAETSNISNLTSRMSDAESDINTNSSSINSLQSEKVNVSDVINNLTSAETTKPLSAAKGKELKDALDNQSNNISSLDTKIDNVATEISNNDTDISNLTTRVSDAESDINANSSSINSLQSEKVNVSDVINNLTSAETTKPLSAAKGKELKDAQNNQATNISNLDTKIDNVATEISNNDIDISNLTAKVSNAESDINTNSSSINSLQSNKVNVSDIINNLTSAETTKPLSAAKGKELKDAQNNQATNISNLDTKIDNVAAEISNNDTDISNLTTRVSNAESDINTNSSSINSLQSEKVNVSDVINNLTSAETTKPLSAAKGKELKDDLDNQSNNFSNLDTKIDNVATEISNNDIDISNLTSKVSNAESDINTNNSSINSLQSNKVNVSDVINNLTSTETTKPLSAAKGKELRDAQNNQETNISNLNTKIDNVAEEISNNDTDISNLTKRVSNAESDINANNSSINSLQSEKVNVSDIINNLTSAETTKPLSAAKGKELKDAQNNQATNISNLDTKIDNVAAEISNNDTDISNLTTRISDAESDINANNSSINSLQSNKVNVSDIINNLTSAETTKPLSAAKGKELKDALDNQSNNISSLDSKIVQKQDKLAGTPELISNKGVANGYAELNSEGKIPSSQLPDMNISETHVVDNNSDIFALSSVNKGNIVIVKNENKTYINTTGNNNDMSDWVELSTPNSGVTTVNSLTGNVTIDKNSIGLSNVENKSSETIRSEIIDINIPNSIARKSDLNSYTTTTEINQKIENKADKTDLTNLTTRVNDAETDISNNNYSISSLQTSKVNVSDVINNLTSSVVNKPLSAAKGKELKETIDVQSTNISNLDSKVQQKQDKLAGVPELISNKDVANGYAGLNTEGKIPSSLLPDLNISETYVVDDNTDIFSLSTIKIGNVVIVKNDNKTFINTSGNNNDISDWVELSAPNSGVTTVNNLTGNVTIDKGSLGLSNVENKSSETIRSEITESNIPNNIARKSDLNIYTTTSEINQKLDTKSDKTTTTNLTTRVNDVETEITNLETSKQPVIYDGLSENLLSLPVASENTNKLWYVKNLSTAYQSDGTNWVRKSDTYSKTEIDIKINSKQDQLYDETLENSGELSTISTFFGKVVYVKRDGIAYKYNGSSWEVILTPGAVSKVNNQTAVSGNVTIKADHITEGSFAISQIPTGDKTTLSDSQYEIATKYAVKNHLEAMEIDASKITSGKLDTERLNTVSIISNSALNNKIPTEEAVRHHVENQISLIGSDGFSNVKLGTFALSDKTPNTKYNTAVGVYSSQKNDGGEFNSSFGYQSLKDNTSADKNSAFGAYALNKTTAGNNSAFGYNSLGKNTTGTKNTAYGNLTLYGNTTGNNNTSIGYSAGSTITSGNQNITIGYEAQVPSPSESNQISIGNLIYARNSNIGIGENNPTHKLQVDGTSKFTNIVLNSGVEVNEISNDTTLSSNSDMTIPTEKAVKTYFDNNISKSDEQFNTKYGTDALKSKTIEANSNSAFGYRSLHTNSSGDYNSSFGQEALYKNTESANSAFGYQALYSNTTGTYNTATGYQALLNNISSHHNSAFGRETLLNNTGAHNSAFGSMSSRANTSGIHNSSFGSHSLFSNTGSGNTAMGSFSLYYSNSSYNTGFGFYTLHNNSSGIENTAMGKQALLHNVNGSHNVAIGSEAGISYSGHSVYGNVLIGYRAATKINNYGNYNTVIGYQAGDNITTGDNNIIIGYDTDAPSPSENNQINIGNLIYGRDSKLGIGTNNPSYKFHVVGISYLEGKTYLGSTNYSISNENTKLNTLELEYGESINKFSNDEQLSGNSNSTIPTEFAVKTYVDNKSRNGSYLKSTNYNYLNFKSDVDLSSTDYKIFVENSGNDVILSSDYDIGIFAENDLVLRAGMNNGSGWIYGQNKEGSNNLYIKLAGYGGYITSTKLVKKNINNLDFTKVDKFLNVVEVKSYTNMLYNKDEISLIIEEEEEKNNPFTNILFNRSEDAFKYNTLPDFLKKHINKKDEIRTEYKFNKNGEITDTTYYFSPKTINKSSMLGVLLASAKYNYLNIKNQNAEINNLRNEINTFKRQIRVFNKNAEKHSTNNYNLEFSDANNSISVSNKFDSQNLSNIIKQLKEENRRLKNKIDSFQKEIEKIKQYISD